MATCFVAMPISMQEIYAERYSDQDHWKHVLDHLFTPALMSLDHEVIPPSTSGSELIHAEIIRNLEECNLVLCDISTLNPNVFFELGIRTSLDRPAVLVRDNFTVQIPFDTGSLNTYKYDAALRPWALDREVAELAKHISNSVSRAGDRNSLWRYFGLTQRAVPAQIANPTEEKLDLLISQVTRLAKLSDDPSPPRVSSPALRSTGSSPLTIYSSEAVESSVTGSEQPITLTNKIPEKYRTFVQKANEIANVVAANITFEGYDEERNIIYLDASPWMINEYRVEDIQKLARNSSANFALKIAGYR